MKYGKSINGKSIIGKVCYIRVRVADIFRADDGRSVEEVVVVSCDRRGNPVCDPKTGRERWYYVGEDELIPANVAASERKVS